MLPVVQNPDKVLLIQHCLLPGDATIAAHSASQSILLAVREPNLCFLSQCRIAGPNVHASSNSIRKFEVIFFIEMIVGQGSPKSAGEIC
jgi:hypothetical protein